jgi:hypothetical protein
VFFVFRFLGLASLLFGSNYNSLNQKARTEYVSHVVSNMNAIFCIYGGMQCYVWNDEGAYSDAFLAAFGKSPQRNFFLMMLAGYLFYGMIS